MTANTAMRRVRPDTDEFVEAHRPEWIAACKRRMAAIDALHPEMRKLVHEYGWEPVRLLMELGAKRPGHVEHIIRACRGLDQSREGRVTGHNRQA